MSWVVEHTDTYGGEANYCWVRHLRLPTGLTDRQIVRQAKAFAGLTGVRAQTMGFGDGFEIRPYGICQIVFVTWVDDDEIIPN